MASDRHLPAFSFSVTNVKIYKYTKSFNFGFPKFLTSKPLQRTLFVLQVWLFLRKFDEVKLLSKYVTSVPSHSIPRNVIVKRHVHNSFAKKSGTHTFCILCAKKLILLKLLYLKMCKTIGARIFRRGLLYFHS